MTNTTFGCFWYHMLHTKYVQGIGGCQKDAGEIMNWAMFKPLLVESSRWLYYPVNILDFQAKYWYGYSYLMDVPALNSPSHLFFIGAEHIGIILPHPGSHGLAWKSRERPLPIGQCLFCPLLILQLPSRNQRWLAREFPILLILFDLFSIKTSLFFYLPLTCAIAGG